jgi:type II secretory pathway component GspD/PulD (secretin)
MSAAGQGPNSFENVQKLQQSLAKLEEIIKQTIDAQQNFMSSSVGSSSAGSASLGAASVPLKPPTIKFYKDADLLIVVGSPEAVETARKIIDALPGQSVQQTGGGATMGGAAPAGSH